MRELTILVTGAGSPGTFALARALRGNGERAVTLIGCDMQERAIGARVCDAFELVPPGTDAGFAPALIDLCRRRAVDVVLPQLGYDLAGLVEVQRALPDVCVIVGSAESVRRADDKAETFALLDAIGVRAPAWRRATGGDQLAAAARSLGYPDRDVCMKPVVGAGSRGFRVLSARADLRDQLLNARPGDLTMRLEDVCELLGDDSTELLVMELATGIERTVDGFARDGTILIGHPKTRESLRSGLAMWFETLEDPALMDAAGRIVGKLGLDGFFNVQFVGDACIEINARISTIVYQPDLNLPYLGVRAALGEVTDAELRAAAARVRPGRIALRYFDQVEWDPA